MAELGFLARGVCSPCGGPIPSVRASREAKMRGQKAPEKLEYK
jgi:hypothetical protein